MTLEQKLRFRSALSDLGDVIHRANSKWWVDINVTCGACHGYGHRGDTGVLLPCEACKGTGHPVKERNVGEMLMLCVSELAEAMEGHRKNLMDDKLPHRPMLEVEIADAMIRLLDLGKGLGLDVAGALIEKHEFNQTRHDHTEEARKAEGGKAY